MESMEEEKTTIISSIEADGRAEEQEIIREAESQAAEKRKYGDQKVESLLKDAHEESQKQAEAVKKKMISSVQLELRRRSLRVRDEVLKEITGRVEKKLDSMIGDADYRTILIDWTTEAAIGLDAESARINTSQKERVFVDEPFISEVTEKIRTKTGRQITLQLSQELPLKYQGVVLTAADGRTAFNNQIKTRILRKEREIRMAVYNTLFTDNRKEQ